MHTKNKASYTLHHWGKFYFTVTYLHYIFRVATHLAIDEYTVEPVYKEVTEQGSHLSKTTTFPSPQKAVKHSSSHL